MRTRAGRLAAAVAGLVLTALVASADGATATPPGGTAVGWGRNWLGELGDGTTENRYTAVATVGVDGLTAVAAGLDFTLARRADGTAWAWGRNDSGELGDGTLSNSSRPVPVGAGRLDQVVSVAAGANHGLALRADGSVWAWGSNFYGQLGDGLMLVPARPVPLPVLLLGDVVAVAAAYGRSLALKQDGTVWAWGGNVAATLTQPGGCPDPGVLYVNCNHALPVQITGLADVVAIAAGGGHNLALRSDGTVWAWGYNAGGQLGDGTTTSHWSPAPVAGLSGVVAVAAGGGHNLALRSDGTVWAWGNNGDGQLGDGTRTSRLVPAPVPGLAGAVRVAAGQSHSLAGLADVTVRAWGGNGFGQLGDGTASAGRASPVAVTGVVGVVALAAGATHSVALSSAP